MSESSCITPHLVRQSSSVFSRLLVSGFTVCGSPCLWLPVTWKHHVTCSLSAPSKGSSGTPAAMMRAMILSSASFSSSDLRMLGLPLRRYGSRSLCVTVGTGMARNADHPPAISRAP